MATKLLTKPKTEPPDWHALAEHYCNTNFIIKDPISFPHAFKNNTDWRDAECVGFIAALLSYGRRDKILETVAHLLHPLGDTPVLTLCEISPQQLKKALKGFYYRFNTAQDMQFLFMRLAEIYTSHGSLKAFFADSYHATPTLQAAISHFRKTFLYGGSLTPVETYGLKFLMADPLQNSAAKRFNMFLRWMVRQDAVDLGLWSDILSPAKLIFPLDTHVAAMARHYGITLRKTNDWKTAEEITAYFRKVNPTDPVRYDFALFGLGIARSRNAASLND